MSGAAQRFLLTLLLTLMWSASFLFIKLAVAEIPIWTIDALRVSIAAILLGAIMLWKRLSFPKQWQFWLHTTVFALLSSILPFCLFCYAEQTIDSALAAVLNGTTPMFTALLAHLLIPSDRLDSQKGVGITLSVAGLICLFWPTLQQGVSGTVIGMGAAAVAAFCYGLSHVYAKKYFSGHPPFVAPTAQLAVSSLILLPMSLFIDHSLWLPMPSLPAILGVCCLSFLGTFLAFILYYRLLEMSGPTSLSMTACFIPVGGMILGALFLGESITLWDLFAASLILAGIAFVNDLIKLPKAAVILFTTKRTEI